MKKVFFGLLSMCFCFPFENLKAQCREQFGTRSDFLLGLGDNNRPLSSGITSGEIYISRETPVSPSDPIATYKWVSIYAVNSYTYDEYSVEAYDNGGNGYVSTNFSFNQDNYDLINYSWEVYYSDNGWQLRDCSWVTDAFKIKQNPILNDYLRVQHLSLSSARSLPFLHSISIDTEKDNRDLAMKMRNSIAHTKDILIISSNQ